MSNERLEKIIEKRNALESSAKKYPDVLGDEFAANCGRPKVRRKNSRKLSRKG